MKLQLEERDTHAAAHLALADFDEALAAIEILGGVVRRARLDDRAPRIRFCRKDSANERDTYAAAKERRIDDEPMDVDRLTVELPGDDAGDLIVDERREKVLSAGAELVDGLGERRNRVGADQLRLDAVRATLNVEHGRRDGDVGDVELCDDGRDARSLTR